MNSQKPSKHRVKSHQSQIKKSLDLNRGPQIWKRSLMLNIHCVRVFHVGYLYIKGSQPKPHVKCHQITRNFIRSEKSPNRHRTNSTIPSQVSTTSQCIIVQIHQCSCKSDKIPRENSQTSMLQRQIWPLTSQSRYIHKIIKKEITPVQEIWMADQWRTQKFFEAWVK
jgi:hypothetical protein